MHSLRLPLLAALLLVTVGIADEPKKPAEPPEGVLPVGADGKALNLDFETGDLRDWTAEGDAFKGQPIKGDTVHARRADMKSQHQGQYWIGGYEKLGDKPQGTLTSVPFKITHPWASFLVAGGPHPETCVELVRNDTKEVFFRASGMEEENLRRVAVDLTALKGNSMFIRLVDRHSGHWGHVNFDDFRFHSTKPIVPDRPKPQTPDVYKYAGLPPDKAAAAMTVPEGFSVSLLAGEPDVCQPIAMCFDDRGRLWVAEAYSYPVRRADKDAKDRILIFEDTTGAGKFDKRTVFMEGLNLVSGLEVGFGGVWIGAAPYLMFVPMKDDKPAGPPQILLDGWHYEDTHETLNAFCWGPDGWLYGCHGVFTHSRVGKPGTPDKDRIPINAGVWRFHPTKHIFEVFAHGTSNPWGLDFDAHGQAFVTACVIPHAYHIIQGGRYQRQAGLHFNPATYDDIKTIADHLHWEGANQWAANPFSSSKGGGHAHCGLMLYQGGAWPKQYDGQMFFGNIHGHRLNLDLLRPSGSGFVASHGPDFLLANDAWARFINLRYGPDGNVYLIDWYDKQACHVGPNANAWDRTNGRIFKISYRGTTGKPDAQKGIELLRGSAGDLVELQLHQNDWFVRHARRLLQERAARGQIDERTREALAKIAFGHKDETRRLRALWALHVTGGLTPERLQKTLADESPYMRAWTIQFLCESPAADGESLAVQLRNLAGDPSPIVRLYIAAALQRPALLKRPAMERSPILSKLLSHPDDFADHNLALMYWYALEPLAETDPERMLARACYAARPALVPFAARRVASAGTPEALAVVVRAIDRVNDPEQHLPLLRGTQEALKGRRQVGMPKEWPDVFARLSNSNNAEVRRLSQALAVTFGDVRAFDALRATLADPKADLARRQGALVALLDAGDKGLAPVLHKLIAEPSLRGAAIRGLASYDDSKTPEIILDVFRSLRSDEKRDALNTLSARRAYGKALVEAIATKKLAANEVPAEVVRQLRTLGDADIDKRLAEVWGIVRTTPADRVKMIADHRKLLLMPPPVKPDAMLGRAVFAKTCQQCHTLYGVGGKVGPDITGSNRANLDYLLENILDPSAVIPKEYAATQIVTKRGRSLLGIVKEESTAAITLATANETVVIPRDEIDTRTPSETSMMPDDLVKKLTETELRALIAYLQSPVQTPMLATAENAKDLFNGKDLTGWDGDAKLWKVEIGEIVGTSPGIKKNEFLRSHLAATDFRLTLKVKLTPDRENSGVQFRSDVLPDGEVKGPQADVGAGWWGKLYEENGRGLIWDKSGEKHVKPNDWNEYVVEAVGSHVRTWINGQACVDLDDAMIARRGVFAFQIHSGGAMEVRFKDIKLELLAPKP
jgi:putative membrane-bound dehydrogenase-like protein